MKVLKQLILGVLVVISASSSLMQTVAFADPGGRTWGHGYFTNIGQETRGFGNVFPEGIPATTDKETFINTILGKWNGTSQYRKTGAAFIIQTMRGQPYNYSRPSDADIADWAQRIRNPGVSLAIENNYYYPYNSGYMDAGNPGSLGVDDDAFYAAPGYSPAALIFKAGGQDVYVIQLSCANPLGDFPGLPKSSQWSISASSSVSQGTAKPGDTVTWTHHLNNNGPDPTDQTVYSQLALGGFTNGWPGAVAGGNVGAGAGVGTIRNITSYATYTIGQNDVGNTLCQRVDFSPAGNGGGSGSGNTPCVSVPYNYTLTPQVSLNGQTTIEAGGQASITNTVTDGGATKTQNTDWRLTRMIYQPGTTLSVADKAARDSGGDPCATFTGGGRTNCDVVQEDGGKVFMPGTTTFVPIYKYIADSTLATGTQVCFAVSVSRPTQDPNPVWRHSQLACMMVSKKPKLQVHGGDIRVGGRIETGLSTVTAGASTKTYGSWVEYGALSVGPNSGFASGSGLNNGGAATPSAWNRLTFANIDDSGTASYGNYAMPPRFASLVGQFTAANPSGGATSNLSGLGSGTYSAGNLTITGGSIGQDAAGKGKSIVILASGTVTISGDISYVGPGGGASFTQLSQLPQVVIVAGNINITGAVKNIDAWLMTSGTTGAINTCSDVAAAAALNSTVCGNVLKVNGPVVTSHLYLRRTAGADDGTRAGDPAEIFNLRADADLWQQDRSTEAGKAQTVYTNELPPRF